VHLAGRLKWLASAVAAYAMTIATFSADAPQVSYTNPVSAPNHLLNPTPVMGIRGELKVLKLPFLG